MCAQYAFILEQTGSSSTSLEDFTTVILYARLHRCYELGRLSYKHYFDRYYYEVRIKRPHSHMWLVSKRAVE